MREARRDVTFASLPLQGGATALSGGSNVDRHGRRCQTPRRCGPRRDRRRRGQGLVHPGRHRSADGASADHRHGGLRRVSTVLAIANIPNNVVTTSSIQGVSRAVAGAAGHEEEAQRRALLIHAALAPCLAALFWATGAPRGRLRARPPHRSAASHLRWRALRLRALHAARRRAERQAPVSRAGGPRRHVRDLSHRRPPRRGVLSREPTRRTDGRRDWRRGRGRRHLPVAWIVAGTGRPGSGGPSVGAHLLALGPIALGQLFLNLLMQADIWLLRRFAHESGGWPASLAMPSARHRQPGRRLPRGAALRVFALPAPSVDHVHPFPDGRARPRAAAKGRGRGLREHGVSARPHPRRAHGVVHLGARPALAPRSRS